MIARLLRRALRVLLRANTGPVDALVYSFAVCWLAFLLLVSDLAYRHTGANAVLEQKDVWIGPAIAVVLATPLGWVSPWAALHHVCRAYAVCWWIFLTVATLIVTPSIVVFWGTALGCAVASFWLLAREGADDVPVLEGR